MNDQPNDRITTALSQLIFAFVIVIVTENLDKGYIHVPIVDISK